MKTKWAIGLLILTILLLGSTLTLAQEFVDDPEIADMRVRVADVSWGFQEYQSGAYNGTLINFDVTLELWNPYNEGLVSYGSSSCRWLAVVGVTITDSIQHEYWGEACTDDYGPREFPSGLSNETSIPSVLLINQTVSSLPNGTYLIDGAGGTFNLLESDNYYSVNITTHEGLLIQEFEEVPEDWGQILFERKSIGLGNELAIEFAIIPFTAFAIGLLKQKYRS